MRAAAWITGIFYLAMVLAGIIIDLLFTASALIQQGPRPPSAIDMIWNYTSWLDLIALIFAAWLLMLHFRPEANVFAHACHWPLRVAARSATFIADGKDLLRHHRDRLY